MVRASDTKQRILLAALNVFAERGYEAANVSQIAEAVGISAPALYKHYASKRAIFDALLDMSAQAYDSRMSDLRMGFNSSTDQRAAFVAATEDEQVAQVQALFSHTLHDELPGRFRRLMTIEQFNMPELAAQYNRRYVTAQTDGFEQLMRDFVEAGVMRGGDLRAMAVQYASPITLYLGVCDREPSREPEALEVIDRHIRQFNAVYAIR